MYSLRALPRRLPWGRDARLRCGWTPLVPPAFAYQCVPAVHAATTQQQPELTELSTDSFKLTTWPPVLLPLARLGP
eukprot:COSAG03_NODE_52_length_16230_cov_22.987168_5_plen_76_part_00